MTTKQQANQAADNITRQYLHLMNDGAWTSITDEVRAQCIDDTVATIAQQSQQIQDMVGHMVFGLQKRARQLRGDSYELGNL